MMPCSFRQLNPFMPVAAKTARQWYLFNKSNISKKYEWELFIKTPSTTLHQISFELMLHSRVIFENKIGPDDMRQVHLQAWMG